MTTEPEPPEIPAPPAPPWGVPGAAVVLIRDPLLFGPAAGKLVTVRTLTDYGAECSTGWGTGSIRVRWDHVEPPPAAPEPDKAKKTGAQRVQARRQGYTGDPCPVCGALKLRHNGACLICDGCQSTTGCS